MFQANGAHGTRAISYSTNWSGYAATGETGSFSQVSANWYQPVLTCGGESNQYSVFWAGLDGYDSSTVEQVGTAAGCIGATPRYYGWYEMFPDIPVYFTNPVRPGDRISASVTFSGISTYTLMLRDSTSGWTQTVVINRRGLERSSAEVVTEAPSSIGGVLPLANFGTVNYFGSTVNGGRLALLYPVQIVMLNDSGQPKDATGPLSFGGAFSNTWLRSS